MNNRNYKVVTSCKLLAFGSLDSLCCDLDPYVFVYLSNDKTKMRFFIVPPSVLRRMVKQDFLSSFARLDLGSCLSAHTPIFKAMPGKGVEGHVRSVEPKVIP